MFVGHYAASFALKSRAPMSSLGALFLAVQFVDILFFPLVLAGVERLEVIPNYTEATHFKLVYMPYTHSLLAAFLWGGAAYALFRWVIVKNDAVALAMALGVFSHWVFDLVVHTPDLPLWSDASPKLGFGLWNFAVVTWVLEAVLLLVGLWLYLRATTATSTLGRYGPVAFVALLLLINVVNVFGPANDVDEVSLAVVALVSYLVLAGIAFWVDAKRRPTA